MVGWLLGGKRVPLVALLFGVVIVCCCCAVIGCCYWLLLLVLAWGVLGGLVGGWWVLLLCSLVFLLPRTLPSFGLVGGWLAHERSEGFSRAEWVTHINHFLAYITPHFSQRFDCMGERAKRAGVGGWGSKAVIQDELDNKRSLCFQFWIGMKTEPLRNRLVFVCPISRWVRTKSEKTCFAGV